MEEYREEQIATLGGLIKATEDLETAYLNAARGETAEHLKDLYRQYASASAKAIAELKTELGLLGGDENEIGLETEDSLVPEIDRPEVEDELRRSLTLYEKAMDMPWPGNIPETLARHFTVLDEAPEHLSEAKSMQAPERAGNADSDTPDSYPEERREAA